MSDEIWMQAEQRAMPAVETVGYANNTAPKTATSASKPAEIEVTRLRRGFSKASSNFPIIIRAREIVLSDVTGTGKTEDQPQHIVETPVYTFVLPNINAYPDGLKAFLYKELIEMPTLVSLEQGGFLNWWADIGIGPRLYPMLTTGDGNCLLHAASLAMWGFHDRQLTLRKLLACNMTGSAVGAAMQRRWRWQQIQANKQCGLLLSEEEWEKEWQFLVKLACPEPKNCTSNQNALHSTSRPYAGQSCDTEVVFESLEELHVFILAHIIRRPIIVIAKSVLTDANGDALAPIPFGGIYLPLECSPTICHRSPLLLTYDAAHFCALVWMDGADGELTIPVVNPKLELLPIHFVSDPGPDYDWSQTDAEDYSQFPLSLDERVELLEQYMDIKLVPLTPFGSSRPAEAGARVPPQRTGSFEAGLLPVPEEDRKAGSRKQIFGSLTRKLKQIGATKSRKAAIGTATQSSRKTNLAMQMVANRSQVLCAGLVKRSMFHQDELVHNYLDQAKQRFDELRSVQQQQAVELQRRLSTDLCRQSDSPDPGRPFSNDTVDSFPSHAPVSATSSSVGNGSFPRPSQMYRGTLPPLERQNTLLLTGKSKFYTLCSEEHSQKPDPYVGQKHVEVKPEKADKSKGTQWRVIDVKPATNVDFATLQTADKKSGSTNVARNDSKQAKKKDSKRRPGVVVATESPLLGLRTSENNPTANASSDATVNDDLAARNHSSNTAYWTQSLPIQPVTGCPHSRLTDSDCHCSVCFQAKRYSSRVGYPTAFTKF